MVSALELYGLGALPRDNNNPFALIQTNPSPWQGLVPGSSGFLKFTSAAYGVRAGFINLVNRYLRQGLDTIEKIFPVYAPASHGNNDPASYISLVESLSGINRKQKIDTAEEIYSIGRAIVQVEEGNFWLSQADFDEGFRLAMINRNIDIAVRAGGTGLLLVGVGFGIWYFFIRKKKTEDT